MASENEGKRETLAAIAAEIRSYGDRPPPKCAWLDIADRIEAIDSADAWRSLYTQGNEAAMREALVRLKNTEMAFCENNVKRGVGLSAFGLEHHTRIMRELIDAALSAPARNCDLEKYATVEGASTGLDEFCEKWLCSGNWCCDCPYFSEEHLMPCGAKWLLAPAAERKGEGDGR